eukprot:gnl/MRDRNA2_/MRDRNA2_120731_c0_seq1.p1 gnl/MRDRNA2_/MRDRNA2_120731_c0~~gnl/MRDRNA2_/MRDRNA2_120731_c0_seq1.p1  ORF type:complete len:516 (-),score=95.03 gnl/MRDRNA2_/MRDRNA2_120731_c0_seq1:84-1538(-)
MYATAGNSMPTAPGTLWSSTNLGPEGWLGKDLQHRLFEVIFAAGVQPDRAFRVLDRDRDGFVSLADFAATLRKLELPLSESDLLLAARAWAISEKIDLDAFARQYTAWMMRRLRTPVQVGVMPSLWNSREAEPGMLVAQSMDGRFASAVSGWDGKGFGGHEVLGPLSTVGRVCECFDLPGYVIFARLDYKGEGMVSGGIIKAFAELCLGLNSEDAARTVAVCDVAGRGVVTYRDFRRYYDHVDKRRSAKMGVDATVRLGSFRSDVRAVLELAGAPIGAPELGVTELMEQHLKRRGSRLETPAESKGFEGLLQDLRLPGSVAKPLIEWSNAIGLVHKAEKDDDGAQPLMYKDLFHWFRRAQSLLSQHLENFFGICLSKAVDLLTCFDSALASKDPVLTPEEFSQHLKNVGIHLTSTELDSVVHVAASSGLDRKIFLPDLVRSYDEFRFRYGSLLDELAERLDRSRIAPDELFARITRATRPPYEG